MLLHKVNQLILLDLACSNSAPLGRNLVKNLRHSEHFDPPPPPRIESKIVLIFDLGLFYWSICVSFRGLVSSSGWLQKFYFRKASAIRLIHAISSKSQDAYWLIHWLFDFLCASSRLPVCIGVPTCHHTPGSTLQTAHSYSRSVNSRTFFSKQSCNCSKEKKTCTLTYISPSVSHYFDCGIAIVWQIWLREHQKLPQWIHWLKGWSKEQVKHLMFN